MLIPMGFFFRRQFCRECFPPERDGGVWEVQRSGPQAEERAGRNRVYFCYYLLFMPDAALCKITLFRVRVLSEGKPSLRIWKSSISKDKTNWDPVSVKETHFALVLGIHLPCHEMIASCWCIINATFFTGSSEWAVLIWFLDCVLFFFSFFHFYSERRSENRIRLCVCGDRLDKAGLMCIPPSNSGLN